MRVVLVFLLLSSGVINAQYQQFGLGLSATTNKFTDEFYSGGFVVQYNTKNTISFRSGCYIDQVKLDRTRYYKTYENDHYVNFTERILTRRVHASIPLLAQVTFGQKVYFTIHGGILFSTLLQKPHQKIDVYRKDYWYTEDELLTSESVDVYAGPNHELNLNYGVGFSFPLKSRFIITSELNLLSQLGKNYSTPDYYLFPEIRFSAGISYQFNFKKNSTYHFTNYSLKLKGSTDGK